MKASTAGTRRGRQNKQPTQQASSSGLACFVFGLHSTRWPNLTLSA